MPGETMSLIGSSIATSGDVASISFSSIPATYTDLALVLSLRTSTNASQVYLTLNGSSAAIYGHTRVTNTGGSIVAQSQGSLTLAIIQSAITQANQTASTFSNATIYLPNYAASTNKYLGTNAAQETNTGTTQLSLVSSYWNNTASINSIALSSSSGNISQYSGAWLYGILKGSGGATVS